MVDKKFWQDKKVFITGHTGFKGGWLSTWLSHLNANVKGYSLNPNTKVNFFEVVGVKNIIDSEINDIRDHSALKKAILDFSPDIVFHMAAQPLVRASYINPIETYQTNVIGTANLLDSCLNCESVNSVINITTDKCYENDARKTGYKETDPMGGYDPYSSSKGCSELLTSSYYNSFYKKKGKGLCSVRAGNVIGGGDWSKDRLIPDFFRALEAKETLQIRSPDATRPWQHVLEPISGYLMLAEKLVDEGANYAEPWNFGPDENNTRSVSQILEHLCKNIKGCNWTVERKPQLHETMFLNINSSKAKSRLGWAHQWDPETALNKTIDWYKAWLNREDLMSITNLQIDEYEKTMKND